MKAANTAIALVPLLPAMVLLTVRCADLEPAVKYILGISFLIAVFGFGLCNSLIPVVAEYTLKKGLCGKDLGKKGTATESTSVPEALGIVVGTVYLMCAIMTQTIFAANVHQMMVYNSALFSVCFMIFLGFTDDTLDLKWRYKLVLPTVASLPLLTAYNGSTAIFIPEPFQGLFMTGGDLTFLGKLVDVFATVDTEAHGAIIELGYIFLVFMGLLAVFCTNSINIYAGINGLECGQAYVIAASILFFKLYEISNGASGEDKLFALLMIIPFIGTALALLRHNWFPAGVFVGDTFCYFAGMTFAVIGIHGHFSKTLMLLFLPQILNFLYSVPQLFKLVPCPRHRLPRVDPSTHLMYYSAFPCDSSKYRYLKVKADATECPNLTIICLVLRFTGPISERSLCIILLALQGLSSMLAFYVRFVLLEEANI
jgi:UDP-N-acetylglucosamine--dolichyl-phosphate N-acetylglucosaminephosphotransferase